MIQQRNVEILALVLLLAVPCHVPLLTRTQGQVEARFRQDVVVPERLAVLQQLVRKDQPLLLRRDAGLVLDPRLHSLDQV